MKKIMLFLLCGILMCTMIACTNDAGVQNTPDTTTPSTVDTTKEPTEDVAGETTIIETEEFETVEDVDSKVEETTGVKETESTEVTKSKDNETKPKEDNKPSTETKPVDTTKETTPKETSKETTKETTPDETNKEPETTKEDTKPSTSTTPTTQVTNHTPTTIELEVLQLMNEERAKVGLPALTYNATIYDCGVIRANECLTKWSHTRPDGTKYWTVFEECDKKITTCCGENLAKTFTSAEQIVDVLMKSESHKKNILYKDFTSVCITILTDERGYYYMSQLFMGK